MMRPHHLLSPQFGSAIFHTPYFFLSMRVRSSEAMECADWSALSAGDLSPSNASGVSNFVARAAERGPALATSRQSGQSGDESPHSKFWRTRPRLSQNPGGTSYTSPPIVRKSSKKSGTRVTRPSEHMDLASRPSPERPVHVYRVRRKLVRDSAHPNRCGPVFTDDGHVKLCD